MELPDIPQIARELHRPRPSRCQDAVFRALAALAPAQLRALGERYLASTRVHRKTDAPFFVDKMPNNCLYVGLIHADPAEREDHRRARHPLGCCFSAFKQHFARGQNFTYDLEDLGRYYRDYVELMAHIDEVLPARVHRVFYESHDRGHRSRGAPAARATAGCRSKRTMSQILRERARGAHRELGASASADFQGGIDHWRQFEPWLGPLKRGARAVLERYPAVPEFSSFGDSSSSIN
jgi:hypothetical protein